MKGWFTPTLSALVLRQCLIMGSVSDNWASAASPLESADWLPSLSLRVRHSSPLSLGWGDVSRHVFQWNCTPAENLTGLSCVSHCRPDISRSKRGWIDRREWRKGHKGQTHWGVELVYSSVIPVEQPEIPQYRRVTVQCPNFLYSPGIQMHTKKIQWQFFCSWETDAISCKSLIHQ